MTHGKIWLVSGSDFPMKSQSIDTTVDGWLKHVETQEIVVLLFYHVDLGK